MRIAVLYNLVDTIERGFEHDAISDNEITQTVAHVSSALQYCHEVTAVRVSLELLRKLKENSFDLVFNLCEGIDGFVGGEALIPAYLDILRLPYTGSDSLTLGLCLDKLKTKFLLIANHIHTPRYQTFSSISQKRRSTLRFPLIVKPVREDASVGITVDSVVTSEHDLLNQVEFILKNYHQPALVEEYIDGRELNLAIIGNGAGAQVLPVSEILFSLPQGCPKIVSYEAKWVVESDGYQKTRGVCPADLDSELEIRMRRIALKAYRLLGCRDYARVDFRLKGERPYLLEVNPNPGINLDSGFVRSAGTAGMSYEVLIRRILSEALSRYGLSLPEAPEGTPPDVAGVPPAFVSPRLCACPVAAMHMDQLLQWFNDPDISRYMDNPAAVYTRDGLTGLLLADRAEELNLIVQEKKNRRFIGYCALYNIRKDNRSAEISLLVGDYGFRGKGYGAEILRILLRIAFEHLELNSLLAAVTERNRPALRIFEACGFTRIGIRHQVQFAGAEKLNDVFFEMLREDYVRMKKAKGC